MGEFAYRGLHMARSCCVHGAALGDDDVGRFSRPHMCGLLPAEASFASPPRIFAYLAVLRGETC